MISIIIPVFNEASILEANLTRLTAVCRDIEHEILVSDGGSTDASLDIAERFAKTIQARKGRGNQLNRAAGQARGDILFFLHADARIEPATLARIRETIEEQGYDGGGFSNVFQSHNRRIKLLGRILNLRFFDNDRESNLIFFGDNGIFCKRTVFKALGGFRDIPIMEDYDFSRRMANRYRVVRIKDPPLVVSPRRQVRSGFIKTRLQWIFIRRAFELGVSPDFLARCYRDVR